MLLVWGLALLISFGLRLWGIQHPEEFAIKPLLVWIMLLAPSCLLAVWLFFQPKINKES